MNWALKEQNKASPLEQQPTIKMHDIVLYKFITDLHETIQVAIIIF